MNRPLIQAGSCLMLIIVLLACLPDSMVAQDLDDLLLTADEYYENEQFHSAAQYYQVAAGIQNDDPETLYRLAQSYRAIFNYSMAASYYSKCLDLDKSTYPLASFYLAQMLKSMGNFKDARDHFDQFIKEQNKGSSLQKKEKSSFIKQAELEVEGCLWAIEQLGKSWSDMGFAPLAAPVNSTSNDYAAVSVGDGQVLTITSGKKGVKGGLVDNRFGDYFTDNFRYRVRENEWIEEPHSDHFDRTNTKFSDGVGTYNSAGDKYYFTSCYEGNAFCKLYVAYKENGTWKNPILLNDNVNAKGYDNKHPTLTSGGDTLIFVSNRPGGQGGNDLWYCVDKGNENWGKAKPLPGAINTPFNEASPFCHQGNLLFFSSDGHSGMGGMDIFMAKNFSSSKSEIQNLGTPFNSGYDDSFFSLGISMGFLSSNRPGGQGKFDIYGFNIPPDEENLAGYLEESAEGTQLRSRIRTSDGSNLYAARDEDQFYYDNLSADEKARLERIFSEKMQSQESFDPKDLSKEDFRYYKKLDIATKATIERLAHKRAMQLEGHMVDHQMSPQEKLDWEYYQNVDAQDRIIIDRIIDIKVEAKRRAFANLDPQEKSYTSDPENQERIDSKVQLLSLNSLVTDLEQQQQKGIEKLNQNELELPSEVPGMSEEQVREMAEAKSAGYVTAIERLGVSSRLLYQDLTPSQRNDLHHSAVREYVLGDSRLTFEEKQRLIKQLGIESDPLLSSAGEINKAEQLQLVVIRDAIKDELASNSNDKDLQEHAVLELAVQQMLLQKHLDQVNQRESDTRDLQGQLKQYIAESEIPDPGLEEKIVDEFYRQSQLLLPLLSPKESYYFNTLLPGQQLRIERLASLVENQTREIQHPSIPEKQYITKQYASDQWYYQELSPTDQQIVDELVAKNWNPQEPVERAHQNFIAELSDEEVARINRMVRNTNQELFFDHELENFNTDAQLATINNGSLPSDELSTDAEKNGGSAVIEDQQPNRYQETEQFGSNKTEKRQTYPNDQDNLASKKKDAIQGDLVDYQSLGTQIYFDFNKSTLRAEAVATIRDLNRFISRQQVPVKVLVEGHADDIGQASHNEELSKQRSIVTANLLKSSAPGIEITTRSYGESRPASDNNTALGRQLNRRVELKVLGVSYQPALQTFLVRPYANLDMIVVATGLFKEDIMKWNGLQNTRIRPYQPLRLPVDLDYASIRHLLYLPRKYLELSDVGSYHVVQSGENLFRLSLRYNTTVEELEDLNDISASELIVGQHIRVR